MITRKQTITTTLTHTEKKALDELAQGWGLKSGTILRRLVLFLIENKIDIINLIKKTEETNLTEENSHSLRVGVSDIEKQQLLNIVKEWDFPISAILRRLVRALLTGVIPKNGLW